MKSGKSRVVVLGGGLGKRLGPLTLKRPKPLVPIEGRVLLDFALSNALNANGLVDEIIILVQAHPNVMMDHIQRAYPRQLIGKTIRGVLPPMMSGAEHFMGTADAIRKTEGLFDGSCSHAAVLAGDHLCQMALAPIIEAHIASGAAATVITQEVLVTEAALRFGVFTIAADGTPTGFLEKPAKPTPLPGSPDKCMTSLGMYIFEIEALKKVLFEECPDGHDFGTDIIPHMLHTGRVRVHKDRGYWRDLGTPEALHEASMDLLGPKPCINLYDEDLPIIQRPTRSAAPKFYGACSIQDSIIGAGCIIGGNAQSCILGKRIHLHPGSTLTRSLVFTDSIIGPDVQLTNVIMDVGSRIEAGVILGQDPVEEARRYPDLTLCENGVIVIPSGKTIVCH